MPCNSAAATGSTNPSWDTFSDSTLPMSVTTSEAGPDAIKGHAYGLGVSYGYAWMLSKRWNIALEAGVGLFHTEDIRRDPTISDREDEYIYRYRRWTLAPSKMELSFSYIF